MDLFAILRAFGGLTLIIAIAAALTGLVAAAQGDAGLASGFAITAAGAGFLGGSMRIMAAGRAPRAGVREALAFALLAWTLAPAIAAPPFLFAGAPNFGAAYADALSAATTTGAPAFFAQNGAPGAAILWWNLLQWAGGGATVLTALVVLASANLTGAGLHRSPLFTLEPDRLFDRFASVGRAVFLVYGLGTAAAFIALWATGEGAGTAAAVAMAGVSSGGLLLPDGATTLAAHSTLFVVLAAAPLVFGAFNFALHWDVLRGRNPGVYFTDGEARALVIFFLAALAASVVATGVGDAERAARAGVEGLSLAATGAWDTGGAALSAPFILAFVIIGASPVSTAGGIKLMRIVLLARQAGGELERLAHPSAVRELRFRGKVLPPNAIMSLLAYVLAYVFALAVLMIAFGAAEAPFEVALAAAGAALSNAGPVITLAAGPDAFSYIAEGPALAIFCAGMILGRLEVFAACAVIAPAFWRA